MFDFSNLDLSNAHIQEPLKPGRYVAMITKAEVKDNKLGTGKNLIIVFKAPEGTTSTTIVVANANKQAVEIGLDKLYTLLVYAGHPTPKHPGSVNSLIGLTVGITVIQDGEYTRVANVFRPPKEEAVTEPVDESDAIPF